MVMRLDDHLTSDSLYAKTLSAYHTDHNCETALLCVFNDLLLTADKGEEAILMLLDYSSAFVTINHALLIRRFQALYGIENSALKDKVEFLSCDCIVKETVWNLSEKVDHLVYKYLCVLQGSGIIKMIRNFAKSWQSYKHCTQNYVYGTTRAHGEKNLPRIFTMFHVIFRIWRHLKSPCFSGNMINLLFFHLA